MTAISEILHLSNAENPFIEKYLAANTPICTQLHAQSFPLKVMGPFNLWLHHNI